MPEYDIHIFRAGTHTDTNGRTFAYTEDDLREVAKAYDPAVWAAPLVVGHPALDDPAYGHVLSLRADGANLYATVEVASAFAELVRQKHYTHVSASFWADGIPGSSARASGLYLKHIGFLGAVPGALKGLERIAFADAESRFFAGAPCIVCFADADADMKVGEDHMPEETGASAAPADPLAPDRAKLAAQAAELTAREARIVAAERQFAEARRVADARAVDGLVLSGALAPACKPTVLSLVAALRGQAPAEYAEGAADPVAALLGLLAERRALPPLGAIAGSASYAEGVGEAGSPQAIASRAQDYVTQMAGRGVMVSAAEAVMHVRGGDYAAGRE